MGNHINLDHPVCDLPLRGRVNDPRAALIMATLNAVWTYLLYKHNIIIGVHDAI